MVDNVIEARGLLKLYGAQRAVDAIDLDIRRGEIFGLLGPNGAGKTTTILMMLGLTEISGGSVEVLGFDPVRQPLEVKRRVGYLPDAVGFYDHLTARENLLYTARLLAIPRSQIGRRIMEAMESVQLADVVDKRVATYSRGMRQRLGIAEIVMKKAEVAILDEPTSGLDPHATFELLEMIRGLKRTGVAVLLSSHLLDRVQSVCDRVALFNKGRIALMGTVVELANQVLGAGHPILVEASGIDIAAALRGIEGVQTVKPEGEGALAGRRRSRRARRGGPAHRVGRRLADASGRPAAQPRRGLHALLPGGAPCSVAPCVAKARPSPAWGRCS